MTPPRAPQLPPPPGSPGEDAPRQGSSALRPHAWTDLAEERIRQAQAEGQFDNLPGFGQPIPGIDEPHDELWWVKAKLRREQLSSLPPALAIRLDLEKTLAAIAGLAREAEVRREVVALNERIKKASFGVAWGPSVDVQAQDPDQIVAQWRAARPETP